MLVQHRLAHRLVRALAAASAVVVLASCGASAGSTAAPATGDPSSPVDITLEHAFGSTTLTEAPVRVATWGWGSTEAALALGASRWQILRFAEAPSALPALFTGTRLAVAIAAIAAVLAEYSGSEKGLGRLTLQSIPQLETARAYAAIVVLMAFTLALYAGLAALERGLLPWAATTPKGPVR